LLTATTETATTEAAPVPAVRTASGGAAAVPFGLRRRPFAGIRARFLAVYVGLLAFATFASVVIAERIIVSRLDARIDRELVQESRELERLATMGRDPATGRRFGDDVARIFEVYLGRNIPSHDEALLTFVAGKPFLRSPVARPGYRLDRDPALVARWSDARTTVRGSAETPAGGVTYLAVPLRRSGETLGVFVVARFRDEELRELRTAVYAVAGVGGVVLLVGSLLAWLLAGKVLRPVREVTAAARSISDSDLSRRIPVDTNDEIGELTATFNDMLDRLARAFRTQKRFFQDAGHELRTPITIVRGHLELLDEDPEERRRTLALVLDELDRMSRTVNELLELGKADAPDFLSVEPVDVATLTNEMHAKCEGLDEREWLREGRAEGIVLADRQRLTQAIIQLAQNAVQHGADGERIGVGSALVDGEARFWVHDRGPGIPLDEQEHLWDRFARGSGGARGDGMGLGLSIVKAIADAHGGRVEVASRLGEGATFTVVIPARGRDESWSPIES
jgi:two-component system OmpR family sensor kinase